MIQKPTAARSQRRTISRHSRSSDPHKGEGGNSRLSPKPRDIRRTASIHQFCGGGGPSGAPEKVSTAPSVFSLQKASSKAEKKMMRSNSVTTYKQVVRSSSPSKKPNFVQINLRMFNNYFQQGGQQSQAGFQQLSTRPGSI